MKELWKPIPDFPDYEVSNFGRVRSLKRGVKHILSPTTKGHLRVLLCGETCKRFAVHQLVAKAFVPNPENQSGIIHLNGDKNDNRAENLQWSGYVVTKLPEADVIYIRNNPDNLTRAQLAERYHIDAKTVSSIQLGRTYKSVGGRIRTAVDMHIPDEVREAVKRLYVKSSQQFGVPALAKRFGISETSVAKILRRDGRYLSPNGRRVPDNIREEIRRLYVKRSREFSAPALAKKFGLCSLTVLKIIRESR